MRVLLLSLLRLILEFYLSMVKIGAQAWGVASFTIVQQISNGEIQ